jgi:hypothetical protein
MSIEFLITSFIVVVSPGTGVLYTLAAGLSRGPRASVVAAFECTRVTRATSYSSNGFRAGISTGSGCSIL